MSAIVSCNRATFAAQRLEQALLRQLAARFLLQRVATLADRLVEHGEVLVDDRRDGVSSVVRSVFAICSSDAITRV
jgi:hypothetical protein